MKTELVVIYDRGTEVFGELSKFTKWLSNENEALGGKAPLNLIKNKEGIDLVLLELSRIELQKERCV